MLKRQEVKMEDTWNLQDLFKDTSAYQEALVAFQKELEKLSPPEDALGQDAQSLKTALDGVFSLYRALDKLSLYAELKLQEDLSNTHQQSILQELENWATRLSSKVAVFWVRLLRLDDEVYQAYLTDARLKDYHLFLQKKHRFKAHLLSEEQESLLSQQDRILGAPYHVYEILTHADVRFSEVTVGKEQKPLTHGNFLGFLEESESSVREEAYQKYYQFFEDHKYTLAETLRIQVQTDAFLAKIRSYPSSLEQALYRDAVPVSVYTNLIRLVNDHLPLLQRYYRVRQKVLQKELWHYDLYVPLLSQSSLDFTYQEAVERVVGSVAALGPAYQGRLEKGLLQERWVDKFENKGKASGAFCAAVYDSPHPYILMNYRSTGLNSIFTLTHEAGHAMHSLYSNQNNPYAHHRYTIFEAEVASTFHEQLLAQYLLAQSDSSTLRANVYSQLLNEMVGTIFRQTMFAEFELFLHECADEERAVTLDTMRDYYGALQEKYFGKEVQLLEFSSLECLRISHFYRPFYVYKYATGLVASLYLSQKVLHGTPQEREGYLAFLQSGGSAYPLDSLRKAGVDLLTNEPYQVAMEYFQQCLDALMDNLKLQVD